MPHPHDIYFNEERDLSNDRNGQHSGTDGYSSRGWSESEQLMEEDGVGGVGSLRDQKGKEEVEMDRTFFGTSHFGPQLAAKFINGVPSVPLCDVHRGPRPAQTFTSDTRPFTLASQLRGLISLLPRRQLCDVMVQAFFARYNDHIDMLYSPDFMQKYANFWTRSFALEEISTLDLRWMALLLIVLAFGVLLDRDIGEPPQSLQDREEMSLHMFWGARREKSVDRGT
ncbi:hypothetical protein P7C73_g5485, partial [Tremellales sp. Uapishka_1]